MAEHANIDNKAEPCPIILLEAITVSNDIKPEATLPLVDHDYCDNVIDLSNCQDDVTKNNLFSKSCRTCGKDNNILVPIFEGQGLDYELPVKINKHLPIKVTIDDFLPKSVCFQCVTMLIAWHDLCNVCLEADSLFNLLFQKSTAQPAKSESCNISVTDISEVNSQNEDIQEKTNDDDFETNTIVQNSTLDDRIENVNTVEYAESSESVQSNKTLFATGDDHHNDCIDIPVTERHIEDYAKQKRVKKKRIRPPKTIECDRCDKKFSYNYLLKIHLLGHTKEKPHKCDLCPMSFRVRPSLNLHKRLHINERPFECNYCLKKFRYKSNVRDHIARLHERKQTDEAVVKKVYPKKLKCSVCSETFSFNYLLKQHMVKHTNVYAYKCDECNRAYRYKKSLKDHYEIAHLKIRTAYHKLKVGPPPKTLKCGQCDKMFSSKWILQVHSSTHSDEKPVKCEFCEQSFRHVRNLKVHVERVHLNIKRHKCDLCDHSFSSKYTMESHRRRHTGEKPFICDSCGLSFRNSDGLGRHKKDVHPDKTSGAIPFMCELCNKQFISKRNLKNHIDVTHSTERNFVCEICGACFKTSYHAKRHRSTVHKKKKENKYTCDMCSKTFYKWSLFRRHMRIQHKVTLTDKIDLERCIDLDDLSDYYTDVMNSTLDNTSSEHTAALQERSNINIKSES